MKIAAVIITLLTITFTNSAWAQNTDPANKNASHNFAPWKEIKEENVLWKKDVWRRILTAELQNAPLKSAIANATSFPTILLNGIKSGALKAYANEALTVQLSDSQLDSSILCRAEHACNYPDQVVAYGIKEKWMFDSSEGRMLVRITTIAPLAIENNKSHILFWIAYPDARQYLSQFSVESTKKKMAGLSFDDYFETRQFSSLITKVEPSENRPVSKKRKINQDALLDWPEH